MCGIAGKISFKHDQDFRTEVNSACDAMHYRGPDNIAVHKIGQATLGHCRLAIIDLSVEANQPFYSEDKSYSIVFNGEIYNYKEVKKNLEKEGLHFNTNSDTEVLLKGYIKYGRTFLNQLRGMWAFAIWDNTKNELFISRDRFGEKPFFYYFEEGVFSFASNLAGLKKLVPSLTLNPKGISELFSYQYISQNESIYKGVKKLKPAECAIITNTSFNISIYWELNYSQKIDISNLEAQRQAESILESSVEEKLISDVPLGLFLSGGNDSGLVAALAAKFIKNINSITLATPEFPELDESHYAKIIAEKHGINYHQIDLNSDCINLLPNLLRMVEPFADSSIIPTAAVSEKARQYLTVVLTGDGGDEIFGGYGIPTMLKNLKPGNLSLAPILKNLTNRRFYPGNRYLPKLATVKRMIQHGGILNYCNALDYAPHGIRSIIFQPKFISELEIEQAFFHKEILKSYKGEISDHDAMLYLGVKGYLPDDFLMKVDTGTMSASIESRAPFLDHRLIEFTSSLEPAILMPGGVEKGLLKKICEKHIPKDIVYKKKTGFRIPVREHFVDGWADLLKKFLKEGLSSDLGIINVDGCLRLINWYLKVRPSQMEKLLFSMLVLEIWLRVFHEDQKENINLTS